MRLEETDEMLGIFKAETTADNCNSQRLIIKKLFGISKNMVGNDVLGSTPRFHTHQIAEIAVRQAAFVCKISYRRQTVTKGFCCLLYTSPSPRDA